MAICPLLGTHHGKAGLELEVLEAGERGASSVAQPGGEHALGRARLTGLGRPRAATSGARQNLVGISVPPLTVRL